MLAPERKESQTGPGRGARGLQDLQGRHGRRLLRARRRGQARFARARAARQRRDPRRRARFAEALQGRRARSEGAASSAACRSRTSTTSRRATSSRPTRSSRFRGRCKCARYAEVKKTLAARRSASATQIQRELAELLRDEVKDPRVGPSRSPPSRCRRICRTRRCSSRTLPVASMRDEASRRCSTPRASCARRLSHRLQLYSVPQLHFAYDDSIESGMRAVAADRRCGRRRPQAAVLTATIRDAPAPARRAGGSTACCCSTSRWACRPTRRCSGPSALLRRGEGGPHRHARSAGVGAAARCASATRPSSPSRCSTRDKAYVATLRFGIATTTGDAEGEIVDERPVDVFARPTSRRALLAFTGADPAAAAAPRGAQVSRGATTTSTPAPASRFRARRATVDDRRDRGARLRAADGALRVGCSKGTYVRVLAEDLGAALGSCAHLAALRRTASRAVSAWTGAITLDALWSAMRRGRPRRTAAAGRCAARRTAAPRGRCRRGHAH